MGCDETKAGIPLSTHGYTNQICETLRSRICSGQLQGGEILFEDTLAREFALSRTPIRQVLHRLALEHFVETKTGVGTIIIPVDRFDFVQDLRAGKDLLRLATNGANADIDTTARFELSGLSSIVDRLQLEPTAKDLWDYSYRVNVLITAQLKHDLLAETFFLLSCRISRRFISVWSEDKNQAVGIVAAEYSAARSASTVQDLVEAKRASFSDIMKAYRQILRKNPVARVDDQTAVSVQPSSPEGG
jgi:DNA-binding GntR family transcriptional regulator